MLSSPIDTVDLVVVDVETTGLEPHHGDRICELGAIRLRGGQEVGRFHTMVNPGCLISPGAFAVNRITPDMVANAPFAAEVLPTFLVFAHGAVLAAYNAAFDLGFLNAELARAGLAGPAVPIIDVLRLARRLLPQLDRHPLWNVARYLGVADDQAHRAIGDAEITGRILLHLLSTLKTRGAVTVADVLADGVSSFKRS